MKITNKLKAEILNVYNAYWDNYLEGDVEAMTILLADEYTQVGSADTEVFYTKKDAVNFLYETIDQVAGKLEMRNRSTRLEQQDNLILIHELCDLYVVADDKWAFYAKARASTLMQKKKEGWKIIHQHSSFPDARTSDGENMAIDKIAEENRELREAVKRRTVELEQKNRELKIETALEKVRSSALAMKEPAEMLDVCKVISDQLKLLGVNNIRNVQTAIINEHKGTYLNYQYFIAYDKGIVEDTEYNKHPKVFEMVQEMKRSENSNFSGSFEGEELNRFREYRKQDNQFPDPLLDAAKSVHYYFYSIGSGGLGLSTYEPLNDDALEIFKRFHNVFTLAYRRFIDIEKAEAQAKEAQIELALERVRARTMAMQSSNELKEVVLNIFDGLKSLGVDPTVCNISLIDKKTCDSDVWSAHQTDKSLITYRVFISHFEHPFRKKLIDSFLNKISFSVHELSGDLKKSYIQYLIEHVDYSKVPAEVTKSNKKLVNIEEGIVLSSAYMKYGLLIVSRNFGISNDESDILQRFARVFEQTYTRFLDLQKAESQAREAQIEAALERVRSRTMAMQRSDELPDTAAVLFQEIKKISNEELIQLTIGNYNEAAGLMEFRVTSWAGGGEYEKRAFNLSIEEPIVLNPAFTAWKQKKKSIVFDLTGEQLKGWLKYRNENSGVKVQSADTKGRRVITVAFFSKGHISLSSPLPLSAETIQLLERFAIVFDGTYTRFLDLQKAEAQAREAQIEASLEKVRGYAMGMQSSEDLSNVASVMFDQMKNLGGELFAFGIVLCDKHKDMVEQWHNLGNEGMISPFSVPVDLDYIHRYRYDKWKAGEELFSIEIPEDYITRHFELMFELPSVKAAMDEVVAQGIEVEIPDWEIDYGASFKHGYLLVSSRKPFKENHIFPRFAKVFDQAYTRFLDLQKAEAQAREAQIELSLERIRAQVTAMRESSELLDIVVTMRSEFVALGHEAHYFWHMRWLPERYDKAMTSGDGTRIGMVMTLPRHIHGDVKLVADWEKSDEPTLVFAMDVDTSVEYVEKMITLGDFQQVDPQAPTLDDIRDIGGLTFVMARTTHGEIGFSLPGTVPNPHEESVTTLARFAGVFDLAYKRFEDLKSTERQHREAQIELALERTRTQSMLMKYSSELNDISKTFHEQLLNLRIDSEFSFVWLPDEAKQEHMFWATWVNEINGVAQYQSKAIKYPLDKTEPGTAKCYIDWESGQPVHETYIKPDQIDSFFTTWEELLEGAEQFKPDLFPEGIYYTEAYMKYGCFGIDIRRQLTSEEKEIIRRFSVEFERTYTRFLDLQKAEAQNKIIQAENDRKTKELENARQLQLSMLPKELPQIPNLDIAVYMKTATEVGGDYYDFNVDGKGTLTVVVGDATGHGMMSGMMVSIMKSFFISNISSIDLKEFFEKANNSLKEMQLGRLMMPLIGVQITSEKIIATNAGMPSLLYFRNKSQKAGEFVSNNLPLGGMKGTSYLLKTVRYEKGDTILLMSDGFAELKNSHNEQYGYVRIKEKFRSLVHKSSSGIIEELKTAASQWTNGEPDDDLTFVVIKVK